MSIASKEIYRDIDGYAGLYQVSNYGNIRGLDRVVKRLGHTKRIKGKPLSPALSKKTGYMAISLYKDGKGKSYLVHRLVAQAFSEICGEMFDGCEIDHIDTIRTNNNACNLRVCSRKENHRNPLTRINYKNCAKHFIGQTPWNKGKKIPQTSGKNHFHAKAIIQYDLNGNKIAEFDTITSAGFMTNTHRNGISNCLANRSKTANNYIWKYAEEAV